MSHVHQTTRLDDLRELQSTSRAMENHHLQVEYIENNLKLNGARVIPFYENNCFCLLNPS